MIQGKYIPRSIEKEFKSLLQQFRIVTVTGPRQSGKTTLVRMNCPDYQYCNLEDPETRQLANSDPRAFFSRFKKPLIIDEFQRVPDLVSHLQVMVDEDQTPGSFVLTVSEQLTVRQTVAQSLVGRTALLTLLPLSLEELISDGITTDRDELIWKGFLPVVHAQDSHPTKVYRNYFQTYIDKDLARVVRVRDIFLFENFVRLLSGRIGQVLNLHSISQDLGVSSPTLAEWLSALEAAWIVFKLPPYHANIRKRLVKSPKIYFTDVGLATYLLGLENPEQVNRDPLIGNLFENMVVMEALKTRLNLGKEPELYFYRDSSQNEVDLVFRHQRKLFPIEIKSAMTYHDSLMASLHKFQKVFPNETPGGYLIYSGEMEFKKAGVQISHYSKTSSIVQSF